MSDIVERLRAWVYTDSQYATAREAADEIERLRGQLSGSGNQVETGQPVLTDEEREAIQRAIDSQQDRAAEMHSRSWTAAAIDQDCDTLRGMLERLG